MKNNVIVKCSDYEKGYYGNFENPLYIWERRYNYKTGKWEERKKMLNQQIKFWDIWR